MTVVVRETKQDGCCDLGSIECSDPGMAIATPAGFVLMAAISVTMIAYSFARLNDYSTLGIGSLVFEHAFHLIVHFSILAFIIMALFGIFGWVPIRHAIIGFLVMLIPLTILVTICNVRHMNGATENAFQANVMERLNKLAGQPLDRFDKADIQIVVDYSLKYECTFFAGLEDILYPIEKNPSKSGEMINDLIEMIKGSPQSKNYPLPEGMVSLINSAQENDTVAAVQDIASQLSKVKTIEDFRRLLSGPVMKLLSQKFLKPSLALSAYKDHMIAYGCRHVFNRHEVTWRVAMAVYFVAYLVGQMLAMGAFHFGRQRQQMEPKPEVPGAVTINRAAAPSVSAPVNVPVLAAP